MASEGDASRFFDSCLPMEEIGKTARCGNLSGKPRQG